MASRTGMFLSDKERKNLLADLQRHRAKEASPAVPKVGIPAIDPTKPLPAPTDLLPTFGTGCLACGEDDDHANLLLCEGCNAEYHTYCLSPPLRCVPAGDWFCGKCKVPSFAPDGLDRLVNALPPAFTSRFGEVCWAHGGIGFGWWPSCIYDPRLTVGSARQLARKHLGKRHLVYFFECHDAPFTCLPDAKIVKWEAGLREDYHVGKTAKSAGKARYVLFQQALQAATIEAGKPIELRMDFNHSDHPQVLPSPKMIRKKSGTKRKRRSSSGPPGLDEAVSVITPQDLSASLDDIANEPAKVPESPSATQEQPNQPTQTTQTTQTAQPATTTKTTKTTKTTTTTPSLPSVATRNQSSPSVPPQPATTTTANTEATEATGATGATKVVTNTATTAAPATTATTTSTAPAISQPAPPTPPIQAEQPITKVTTRKSPNRPARPTKAVATKQPAQPAQPAPPVAHRRTTFITPFTVGTTTTTTTVLTTAPTVPPTAVHIPVATGNTSVTEVVDKREPAGKNISNVPVLSTVCCKILKQTPNSTISVGFVQLTDKESTFADARRVMEEESVPDTIPSQRWKFFIPGLGPVSHKQEKTLGPMLVFLRGTSTEPVGLGTWLDPVCVTIVESVMTPSK